MLPPSFISRRASPSALQTQRVLVFLVGSAYIYPDTSLHITNSLQRVLDSALLSAASPLGAAQHVACTMEKSPKNVSC